MKDLMKMMQQASQIQGRMQAMQDELAALELEGQSGAGMVRVTLTGKGEMKSVRIDPGLMKPGEAAPVATAVSRPSAGFEVQPSAELLNVEIKLAWAALASRVRPKAMAA